MTINLGYWFFLWYAIICPHLKVPAAEAYWIDNHAKQILPADQLAGGGTRGLFTDFVLSRDGTQVLTIVPLNIWNLADKSQRLAIPPHGGYRSTRAIAWSGEGRFIATAAASGPGNIGGDYEVRLWNAATGELDRLIRRENDQEPKALAFSPDGSLLCWVSGDWFRPGGGGGQDRLSVYSLQSRESVTIGGARGATGTTLPGTVAASSKPLLISRDNRSIYYNTTAWRLETAPQLKLTKARDYLVSIMAVSPDDRFGYGMHYLYWIDPVRIRRAPWIYVVGRLTAGYWVTDAMRSRELALYQVNLADGSIAARREFASGHENPQTADGRPLAMSTHDIAVSPDGSRVALATLYGVHVIDLRANKDLAFLLYGPPVSPRAGGSNMTTSLSPIAFLPDGRRIIGGTISGGVIWELP